MGGFAAEEDSYKRLLHDLKNTFDPNQVLAPGRYTGHFGTGKNLGNELGQKKSGAKILLAPEIQTVLAWESIRI